MGWKGRSTDTQQMDPTSAQQQGDWWGEMGHPAGSKTLQVSGTGCLPHASKLTHKLTIPCLGDKSEKPHT